MQYPFVPRPEIRGANFDCPALALRAFGARKGSRPSPGQAAGAFRLLTQTAPHPPGAGGWRGWWLAPPSPFPPDGVGWAPSLSPAGRGMDSRIPFPRQRPEAAGGFV